jgi:hypothetical protein
MSVRERLLVVAAFAALAMLSMTAWNANQNSIAMDEFAPVSLLEFEDLDDSAPPAVVRIYYYNYFAEIEVQRNVS